MLLVAPESHNQLVCEAVRRKEVATLAALMICAALLFGVLPIEGVSVGLAVFDKLLVLLFDGVLLEA